MPAKDTGTEALIKETAKRVFFAEGRLHATTQDIADAAGISRTSLHYYFRSRDQLMKQVFEEATGSLNNQLYALMSGDMPFREKMERMIDLFITETITFPYKEIFLITEMLSAGGSGLRLSVEGQPHIVGFLAEIEKEVKAKRIASIEPVQFMINVIALCAHPIMLRPLHQSLFKVSEKQYSAILRERKSIILKLIMS